ncbi:MAG: hypothetical protein BWY13_01592 [Euryarchaeota archaeon ADurb.Bin190]|nr:MAG: hypothetical protein BWY13_01592 [Euryarchaeota archaeon ADurb.Bin190]
MELDLPGGAGVVESGGADLQCAVDISSAGDILAGDIGIPAHIPSREQLDPLSCRHQIGSDISPQMHRSTSGHHLSSHIGVDIDLAAQSQDIALDRRVDAHRAPGSNGRINRCVDADCIAGSDDIICNRSIYGDTVTGECLQG